MPAISYDRRIAEVILELGLYPANSPYGGSPASSAMRKALELVLTYEEATGRDLNEDTCQMILDALRGNYHAPLEA